MCVTFMPGSPAYGQDEARGSRNAHGQTVAVKEMPALRAQTRYEDQGTGIPVLGICCPPMLI